MLPVRMFIKSVQRYLLASAAVCIIYSSCVFLDVSRPSGPNSGVSCKRLMGFTEGGLNWTRGLSGWLVMVGSFPTAQQLTFLHFL